jgi:hypothetical protein
MIDYSKDLVSALSSILPVHHEMQLTSTTKTPCISYQERNNAVDINGDTVGYSRLSYTVKVWGNDIGALNEYAKEIDRVLRPLGWKRVSVGELYDINSTMIQKILTYEALALEVY